MCGFKVGDEVVCIRSKFGREGMIFVVEAVCSAGEVPVEITELWKGPLAPAHLDLVRIEGLTPPPCVNALKWCWGHDASCFRKVQRRDLGQWLSQSVSNTDKLDKSLPALPEKEGV